MDPSSFFQSLPTGFNDETAGCIPDWSTATVKDTQLSPSTVSQGHSALHSVDGGEPWDLRRGGGTHPQNAGFVAAQGVDGLSVWSFLAQPPHSSMPSGSYSAGFSWPGQVPHSYANPMCAIPTVGLQPPSPGTIDRMALFQQHLPDDFPPHQDSMLAELFPNLLSQSFPSSFISRFNPLILVNMLRCESIALHSWDPEDSGRTPTVFSYAATVSHYPLNITRFGVSVGNGSTGAPGLGDAVRAYRIRRWNAGGASVPPQPMYEPWKHGNCAEMQSIPPVVEWCESHGLENVVIFSLAMHKSGKKMPTCANCITYIYGRVLKSNPSWVVVDASTGMGFTSRGAMLPGIWPQYWLGSQAAGGR